MKISALVDIAEGSLLNSPAISFVTQIHTNIKKINDGDAYFATDETYIQKAIDKGSFCIICDFEPIILDEEIAWIRVDDIQKAICNVLRYKLIEQQANYFFIDKILFEFIQLFKTKEQSNILLLSNNILKDFEILYNIDSSKDIYSTDISLLKNIATNTNTISYKKYDINNLTNHSLFETSFSYEGVFYDKLRLPNVYINHFLQVQEIIKEPIDIKKLNNNNLFKPIFINKSNQIVGYGQTNRFILSSFDKDIASVEIDYLKRFYSYANIKIVSSSNINNKELFSHISDTNYNAIYIKNKSITNIIRILEKNDNSAKLF
ncbi:MAG: hypothetical protein U9O56_05245 [Campylobacterota bacterium]|nr:hypothetical protein [Campylobacterota bacterium]